MPISWNEIRQNAVCFSREWAEETREHAEAKSFWDDFFGVFGIPRRSVATFEERHEEIPRYVIVTDFDRQRIEFLFALHERLAAPLLPAAPLNRRARRGPRHPAQRKSHSHGSDPGADLTSRRA